VSLPDHQTGPAKQPSLVVSAFSGIGLGLMVGTMAGLAPSSWLGPAVGLLGTGLAAVLALNDRHFTSAKGVRLGAFGVAVVVAGAAGLYVRQHQLLLPNASTLARRKAEYLALGLSEREAVELMRQWVAIARRQPGADGPTGAWSSVEGVASGGEVAGGAPAARTSAAETLPGLEVANCGEISSYPATWSAPQLLGSLEAEGPRWRRFAGRVRALVPPEDQRQVLLVARDAVCPGRDGSPPPTPTLPQCRQLEYAVGEGGSALRDAYRDGGLEAVYARVQRDISPTERDDALSLFVGALCGGVGDG
jgi:hypothetical protein